MQNWIFNLSYLSFTTTTEVLVAVAFVDAGVVLLVARCEVVAADVTFWVVAEGAVGGGVLCPELILRHN